MCLGSSFHEPENCLTSVLSDSIVERVSSSGIFVIYLYNLQVTTYLSAHNSLPLLTIQSNFTMHICFRFTGTFKMFYISYFSGFGQYYNLILGYEFVVFGISRKSMDDKTIGGCRPVCVFASMETNYVICHLCHHVIPTNQSLSYIFVFFWHQVSFFHECHSQLFYFICQLV